MKLSVEKITYSTYFQQHYKQVLTFSVPIFLYLIGAFHWLYFFTNPDTGGLSDFTNLDWMLASHYHAVLRDAFHHGQLPLVMDFTHYSDRFLGLPETPLSPHYLLLLILDDPAFNLWNILFLHTICFSGLLFIKREEKLSWIPFTFLYLLFEFNGYIVAHTSVGHFMWYGYFFMPYIYCFLMRIFRSPENERNYILLSAMFVCLLLQGSFHIFVWWLIYLMVLMVLRPTMLRPLSYVLILTCGLNLFRLLPSAVSLHSTELYFENGYESIGDLFSALTLIQPIAFDEFLYHGRGNWEVDCYVGIAGLMLLLYFGVVRAFASDDPPTLRTFDYANLVMLLFCMGKTFFILLKTSIPLFTSQRIPTRFIIIPLTALTILAAIRMERFLQAKKGNPWPSIALLILLSFVSYDLWRHSQAWLVTYTDNFLGLSGIYSPDVGHLVDPDFTEPGMYRYLTALIIGGLLSLMFAGFSIYRLKKMTSSK